MEAAKRGLMIADLLGRAATLKDETDWQSFRPGVHIRRLYRSDDTGSSAALLRYQPVRISRSTNTLATNTFLFWTAQSDERGHYPVGTLVVNPPGSTHHVRSDSGCVVLVIWELGVRFPDPPTTV